MQVMGPEALDHEGAQTVLAVQAHRRAVNLEQLQVFKGRHLMAQECYRQLIERLAQQERVEADDGDEHGGESEGLKAACAIVGEAVQEAHALMLQQAGSVRENDTLALLTDARCKQLGEEQAAKEAQTPAASADVMDDTGHVGAMCDDQAQPPAELDDEDDGFVLRPDMPRQVPAEYQNMDRSSIADSGSLVGKTVRQVMQESRPGRYDWKPPSWMVDPKRGDIRVLP